MTLGLKKTALGIGLTVTAVGVAAPAAFWYIVMVLDRALGFQPLPGAQAFAILAASAILIGVFWVSWSYSYLHFVGRGLPFEAFGRAIHPTQVLVTTGPYAYTRNPMVLGLMFIFLGIACLQRSIAGLVLVPVVAAVVSMYLTTFEEKGLFKRFGKDYEEYHRNVPLLIPRVNPYAHEPASG